MELQVANSLHILNVSMSDRVMTNHHLPKTVYVMGPESFFSLFFFTHWYQNLTPPDEIL